MVRGAETEKVFGTEDAAVGGRLTDASAKASPFSSMRPPRSSRDRIAASPLATSSGDASVAAVPPPVALFAEDPSEHARVRKTPTPKKPNARVDPAFMTSLPAPTGPRHNWRDGTPRSFWRQARSTARDCSFRLFTDLFSTV